MNIVKIVIAENDAFSHGVIHKHRPGYNCSSPLKRIGFGLALMFLIMLPVHPSEAQKPFPSSNKPILRMDREEVCWKFSSLALTEDQINALENLRRTYASEAVPIRREIMSLRLELRHFIRDPNTDSRVLFDRQKRISEIQARLDHLSLSYQIKVRSIFTKEQLERLPQDCSLGMELGFGTAVGTGRGLWKGPR